MLIPAPPVSSYCLQKGFHVKATHSGLYIWVFLSAEHAEICNALLFPDLWMELEEGETIPPAEVSCEGCAALCWWVQTEMIDWTLLGLCMWGSVFLSLFRGFYFSLVLPFSVFTPWQSLVLHVLFELCKTTGSWGKERGIENYATGFSGEPEQTGSRVQGTGIDGSFEFGLSSGKAVLSVSDCLFCMCTWQIGKLLFWDWLYASWWISSRKKRKPFFHGPCVGGWDLLHPMFPFPVWCGAMACPVGFSSSWCVKSLMIHSDPFFFFPIAIHPMGHHAKILWPPSPWAPCETLCAALWESGWWLEGTELSWLPKPMAPAQGLQQKHSLLSMWRSKGWEMPLPLQVPLREPDLQESQAGRTLK